MSISRASVIVVGGGFVGTAAAAALANGKRHVHVLEARSGVDPRFRGELIHPTGVDRLAELGLLQPLFEEGGLAVDGFAVVFHRDEDPILLRYREIAGGTPFGLSIAHQNMVARMRREVEKRPGVSLSTGARVVDLIREDDRIIGVRTATGDEHYADLTVVAEGRHSKLRGMLGLAEEAELLSFSAAILAEDTELPSPGFGHVFAGDHGPILAYPIGGGRVRMCVDLPLGIGKGQDAVLAFLKSDCAPSVPLPLRKAMLRSLEESPPELCANHAIRTHRCIAPGAALVGDSGGCSHPLTATGMTIGLNDLAILAAELNQDGPLDGALQRYQRKRYGFVRAREIVAQGLYDVFRNDDAGAQALRRGIARYWGSGARARAASLSLLSGRESRMPAFVAEYLSVVRHAAGSVIGGTSTVPSIGGLTKTAYDQLMRTSRMVATDVAVRLGIEPRAGRGAPPAKAVSRQRARNAETSRSVAE